MSVDSQTLDTINSVLNNLGKPQQAAIPGSIVESLARIAKPGRRLKIDMDASAVIGAPLVMIEENRDHDKLFSPLTARQRQVAVLIIRGKSNQEIACDLSISVGTVKDHVHAILARLGFSSRVALIIAAYASGSR